MRCSCDVLLALCVMRCWCSLLLFVGCCLLFAVVSCCRWLLSLLMLCVARLCYGLSCLVSVVVDVARSFCWLLLFVVGFVACRCLLPLSTLCDCYCCLLVHVFVGLVGCLLVLFDVNDCCLVLSVASFVVCRCCCSVVAG